MKKPNYEKYLTDLISIDIDEILFEFDVLLIFTSEPKYGYKFLFCIVDNDEDTSRYIVTSTSSSIINELKNCTLSVRNAIVRSLMWLVDIDVKEWIVKDAWILKKEDLVNYELPNDDVMLYRECNENKKNKK